MLKDKTLTYISLFSSSGVGCYGFKQEGYECIATNEFIERRLNVQQYNNKCKFSSGYILGDITKKETKDKIFTEIDQYKKLGNDDVDVLIATPPCQGMSVANHKKKSDEIKRNSLVVESIILTKKIRPRFFVFENVSTFLKTGCTSLSGEVKEIKSVIEEELSSEYEIQYKIINFKNYGSNSSRTRTLVIGVRNDYEEIISAIDLFPEYSKEKTIEEVIGDLKPLEWGEISDEDILHAFRVYPEEMKSWISDLKPGMSAFDNDDEKKRPHRIINGKLVPNVRKNAGKYTRQYWDKVAPCIHTRNDQLASQNTIHPGEDRVFSIRELMRFMSIPDSFKWDERDYEYLNKLPLREKKEFYKLNEVNIRQSIGEAVPTIIFRQIAKNIKEQLYKNRNRVNVEKIIKDNNLTEFNNLIDFIKKNQYNLSFTLLSKIAEMANGNRSQTAAYYTNKSLLNYIYKLLPEAKEENISIIEPSVGVGNFLPYIFKKYENVRNVTIDVVDIDSKSLEIMNALMTMINIPQNFRINCINSDFLEYKANKRYFLAIGNPPFNKFNRKEHPLYFNGIFNQDTKNLAALFLEKCMRISEHVIMIEPKFIINTIEFKKTRELLKNNKINAIIDFGEKGFKGVLIETICLSVTTKKPSSKSSTLIEHVTKHIKNKVSQAVLCSDEYPYWILYRNKFFDDVASTLSFDSFKVFRDRQITKSELIEKEEKSKDDIRVLRARNISDDGKSIIDIVNYDVYISLKKAKTKSVYKYLNDENVYLVPNMTYKPRMIQNPKGVICNGSIAILTPKAKRPTMQQVEYFSSIEFRRFYEIARNYQTRSLNIDETSVFFFGLKKENCDDHRK